jgi:hypothetical protein
MQRSFCIGRCRYSCQMPVFGRRAERQRLRRATQESLTVPVFDSPVDCTPWVIGGLSPAELSMITAETEAVADHLRDDLQKIARSANDELKIIRRKGMSDSVRQAEATRVIEQARARAVRRVESTLRHLQTAMPAQTSRTPARDGAAASVETTQVIPAVRDEPPAVRGERPAPDLETTQIIPAVEDEQPVSDVAPVSVDQREQPAPAAATSQSKAGPSIGVPTVKALGPLS